MQIQGLRNIDDLLLIAGSDKTTDYPVLDELMGDADYLDDKFPDADLDPCHSLNKDILDYNTNVPDKKFNTFQILGVTLFIYFMTIYP